jgi:hypothetical protein
LERHIRVAVEENFRSLANSFPISEFLLNYLNVSAGYLRQLSVMQNGA